MTPQSDAETSAATAPAQPPYSTQRDTALKDGILSRLPEPLPSKMMDIAGTQVDIGQVKAGFDALFDTLRDNHGITKVPNVDSTLVVQLDEQTFAKHFAVQMELDAVLNNDSELTPAQLRQHGIDNPQSVLNEILSPDFMGNLANNDPAAQTRLDTLLNQVATAKVDPKPGARPDRVATMVDNQRTELVDNTRSNPARSINGRVLLNTGHLDGMATNPDHKADAIQHLLTHEFMHASSIGSDRTFAHRHSEGGVFNPGINPDEAMTELLAREITDALAERKAQDAGQPNPHIQYIQYENGSNRYQDNVDALNNELDAAPRTSAEATFQSMLDSYFRADEGNPGTRPAPPTTDTAATGDPTPPPQARGNDVIADESWRHDTARTADWFAPQNPQPPALWDPVRDKAPVRTVDTEGADVQRSSTANNLDSLTGIIKHDVRRMEVAPGSWVKEYTLKVHLNPDTNLTPADVAAVQQKTVEGVDRLLNQGYRLPSGDQFHARVEFVTDPADAHTTVDLTNSTNADQLNWGTQTSSNVLAHEVAHYFGLPDEYKDAPGPDARIFNSDGKPLPPGHTQSNLVVNDDGLMGTGVHGDPSIKPRHLWLIERTTNSQVMVPDADHATLQDPDSPRQTPPPRPPDHGTQPDIDSRPAVVAVTYGGVTVEVEVDSDAEVEVEVDFNSDAENDSDSDSDADSEADLQPAGPPAPPPPPPATASTQQAAVPPPPPPPPATTSTQQVAAPPPPGTQPPPPAGPDTSATQANAPATPAAPYSNVRDADLKNGILTRLPAQITPVPLRIAGVQVDIGQVQAGFDALSGKLGEFGITTTPNVNPDLVVQLDQQTFAKHFAVQQELDTALKTTDRGDSDVTTGQLNAQGIDPAQVRAEILSADFLRQLNDGNPAAVARLDTLLDQVAQAKVGHNGDVAATRAGLIESTLTNPARAINGHVLLNTDHLDDLTTDPARKADAIRHLLTHEFMHVHSVGSDVTFAHRDGQGGVYNKNLNPDEAVTELLARNITDALSERLGQPSQYNQFSDGSARYQTNIDLLNREFDRTRSKWDSFEPGPTFQTMLRDYFVGATPPASTSGTRPAPPITTQDVQSPNAPIPLVDLTPANTDPQHHARPDHTGSNVRHHHATGTCQRAHSVGRHVGTDHRYRHPGAHQHLDRRHQRAVDRTPGPDGGDDQAARARAGPRTHRTRTPVAQRPSQARPPHLPRRHPRAAGHARQARRRHRAGAGKHPDRKPRQRHHHHPRPRRTTERQAGPPANPQPHPRPDRRRDRHARARPRPRRPVHLVRQDHRHPRARRPEGHPRRPPLRRDHRSSPHRTAGCLLSRAHDDRGRCRQEDRAPRRVRGRDHRR
ncbi:hypothetical protein ACFVG9_01795 [Saccharothrix carnea]|uniref:hypothetical protein n=1 Tax=Saccharothrix carnea TaxID=1280637 RepID=UPI000AC53A15